jgi:hypothetical protein
MLPTQGAMMGQQQQDDNNNRRNNTRDNGGLNAANIHGIWKMAAEGVRAASRNNNARSY